MSTQIIFIFLYIILISFTNIISKTALKKKPDTYAYVALHNLAGALIITPLIFFDHRLPKTITPWIFLCFGVLTSFLGDFFYFRSVAIEDISVLTLVFRLRMVLVFFFGALFFGEQITWEKIIAMALVTSGALVANYKKSHFQFSKGVILALFSDLFLGIMSIVDKKVASNISVPLYNFTNFTTSSAMFFLLTKLSKGKPTKKKLSEVPLLPAFIAGTFLSLASMSRRYAFHFGEISMATPLLNLSVVLTMTLAIIFLKERRQIRQKILGASLVILGTLFLT